MQIDQNKAIITILVRSEEAGFHINKNIICIQSPFSRAILTNRYYKEAREDTVRLLQFDTKAFEVYIELLYSEGTKDEDQTVLP